MDHLMRDEYPLPLQEDSQEINQSRRNFVIGAGITTLGILATRPTVNSITSITNHYEKEQEMIRFTNAVRPTFNEIGRLRLNLGYPPTDKLPPGAKYLKDTVTNQFIAETDYNERLTKSSKVSWYAPKPLYAEEQNADLDMQLAINVGQAIMGSSFNTLVKKIGRNPPSNTTTANFDMDNGILLLPPVNRLKTNEATEEFIKLMVHEYGHGIDPDGAHIYSKQPSLKLLKMLEHKWQAISHCKDIPELFLNDMKNKVYFYSIQTKVGDEFLNEMNLSQSIHDIFDGSFEDIIAINGKLIEWIPRIFEDNRDAETMRTIIGDEIIDKIVTGKITIKNKEFAKIYRDLITSNLNLIYQEVFAEMVRTSIMDPEKLEGSKAGKSILISVQELFRTLLNNPKLELSHIRQRLNVLHAS